MKELIAPFSIFRKKFGQVLIWILFVIILSNLGIIFSVFDSLNKGTDTGIIWINSIKSGAFYLNGMALSASYLGNIFIDLISRKKKTKFIKLKAAGAMVSVLNMILLSFNYSSTYSIQAINGNLSTISYWIEIVLYIISIIIAFHIFCVSCMEYEDLYPTYEQYDNEDDENTKVIINKGTVLNSDGGGIKI